MPDEIIFDDLQLENCFQQFNTQSELALAVSGGPDSMALLLLAHRWRQLRRRLDLAVPAFAVLTVDHGMRGEAKDECQMVYDKACELGYQAEILSWTGDIPKTRVQEMAREIRYQMLAGSCHMRGIKALVTAHHLDDQAETLLMRLARGSGVDGLAAMAPESQRYGLNLLRPLLDFSKTELLAELEREGWPYVEDPSNQDDRYERVRLRAGDGDLKKLGLTPDKIGLSSRRLRRARKALEQAREGFLTENAFMSDYGSARVDQLALSDAPEEIAIRALSKILRLCGGSDDSPNMAGLEMLLTDLKADFATNRTLAGCRIIAKGDFWLIVREAGRIVEKSKKIMPGDCMFWDNRYIICADKKASDKIEVGPLGESGQLKGLVSQERVESIPMEARASLLAFWEGDQLMGVPALDFWTQAARKAGLQAKLIVQSECL